MGLGKTLAAQEVMERSGIRLLVDRATQVVANIQRESEYGTSIRRFSQDADYKAHPCDYQGVEEPAHPSLSFSSATNPADPRERTPPNKALQELPNKIRAISRFKGCVIIIWHTVSKAPNDSS